MYNTSDVKDELNRYTGGTGSVQVCRRPANEREAEFYRIVDVPMPSDGVMEAGSILLLPDGRLAVGTRRGELYFATGNGRIFRLAR